MKDSFTNPVEMMGGAVGKRKILILENAIDVTGGLKSILNSSIALSDEFEFIFVLPTGSRANAYVKSFNVSVVELPFLELRKSFLSLIGYLPVLLLNTFRLRRLIAQLRIDLIIANDFYNLLPFSYKFFFGRIPYVCFVRFLPNRFPKILVKCWLAIHKRYAFKIIAVSEAVKSQLIQDPKVQVVYEGLPKYNEALQIEPQKTSSTSTLLYLSNFIEGKGHHYALQSFEPLAKKYPSWKLRFVGGNMGMKKNEMYKKYLMQLSQSLNIQHQVEWSEFQEKVNKEYEEAAIVLNFSNSESFSLTCLEAMLAGRPVIATECGGPTEIIDNMESGILVPVGDVPAMTRAMDFLMTNSEIRATIGETARKRVQSKFNSLNTYERLRAIYKDGLYNFK